MRLVFTQELSKFTRDMFADALELNSSMVDDCLFRLLKRHVIATGAIDESEDSDSVNVDDYCFKWVGLAVYGDITLAVCPKYFPRFDHIFVDGNDLPDEKRQWLLKRMARILRVIRKADAKKRMSPMAQWDSEGASTDSLTPILLLFDYYAEYGEYSNYQRLLESNGSGAVSWERTIEQCSPLLTDAGPMYFELRTATSTRNSSDYVTRLHQYLLTYYSRLFHNSLLGDLLSLPIVDISEESQEDFGDPAYVEYRLEQEYSSQFITWKRIVISLMLLIVKNENQASNYSNELYLGTDSYEHVWETMCKAVFDDKLGSSISSLNLQHTHSSNNDNITLKDIIPYPKWHRDWGKDEEAPAAEAPDTLIPDVVSIFASKSPGKQYFCIYDAKYYKPIWKGDSSKIAHAPGVESITKQFLYQSAYEKFVHQHGFAQVLNMFLVPSADDGETPIHLGRVDFPGVFKQLPLPFTNSIDMWALPADWLALLYLDGQLIGTSTLDTMANISMMSDNKGSALERLSRILSVLDLVDIVVNDSADAKRVSLVIREGDTTNLSWQSEPGKFNLDAGILMARFLNSLAENSQYTPTEIAAITGSAVTSWNCGEYETAIDQFRKLHLQITAEFSTVS